MPRQTLSVSNEVLMREQDTLPAHTKITEQQAAMVLGCHPDTLRLNRRKQTERVDKAENNQAPVPSDLDLVPIKQSMKRGKVRYRLGDVRRYDNRDDHVSTTQRDRKRAEREQGWMGFGTWLANASFEDTWTFTIVDGVPIDFMTSLRLADEADWEDDSEEVKDLTLGEYLQMRLLAARLQSSTSTASTLDRATVLPVSEEGRVCPSCGKAWHAPPCRF